MEERKRKRAGRESRGRKEGRKVGKSTKSYLQMPFHQNMGDLWDVPKGRSIEESRCCTFLHFEVAAGVFGY